MLDDRCMDQTLRNKKGVELHSKARRCKQDLDTLRETRKGLELPAICEDGWQAAHAMQMYVTRRLLVEIFGLKDDIAT